MKKTNILQKTLLTALFSLAIAVAVFAGSGNLLKASASPAPDGSKTISKIFPDPVLAEAVAAKLNQGVTYTPTEAEILNISNRVIDRIGSPYQFGEFIS